MTFNPAEDFEVLEEFDDKKPFDVLDLEEDDFESFKEKISSLLDNYSEKQRKANNKKMTAELSDLIRKEVEKIYPVQNVIERKIEKQTIEKVIQEIPIQMPPPPPVRIIEKFKDNEKLKDLEKEVEKLKNKPEIKNYVEKEEIKVLKKEIEDLKDVLEKVKGMIILPGGSGVIGIPNPQGQEGKFLSSSKGQAIWETVSGGSSNANPLYIGDEDTDGSWRLYDDGSDLQVEKRISGSWVNAGSFPSP